jgi:hypothetical protein
MCVAPTYAGRVPIDRARLLTPWRCRPSVVFVVTYEFETT